MPAELPRAHAPCRGTPPWKSRCRCRACSITRARLGPGEVDARIGRRDVGDVDVELPLRVEPGHLPVDLIDGARRRRDVEMPLVQAAGDAVVDDDAGLVGHEHIARAPDRLLLVGPGVHAVDERGGIRPADVEAAERRHVDHAGMLAHGAHLARRSRARASPFGAVVGRPHPQPGHHHLRAELEVAVVHGACGAPARRRGPASMAELLRRRAAAGTSSCRRSRSTCRFRARRCGWC